MYDLQFHKELPIQYKAINGSEGEVVETVQDTRLFGTKIPMIFIGVKIETKMLIKLDPRPFFWVFICFSFS